MHFNRYIVNYILILNLSISFFSPYSDDSDSRQWQQEKTLTLIAYQRLFKYFPDQRFCCLNWVNTTPSLIYFALKFLFHIYVWYHFYLSNFTLIAKILILIGLFLHITTKLFSFQCHNNNKNPYHHKFKFQNSYLSCNSNWYSCWWMANMIFWEEKIPCIISNICRITVFKLFQRQDNLKCCAIIIWFILYEI